MARWSLPEPMRPQQLLNLLHRLGHPDKTPWNVRIMERYRHGAGVVTSLARSLRGGPIKNARLVAWDGARRHLSLSGARRGAAVREPLTAAHDLVHGRTFSSGGCCMCQPLRHAWCGAMGCTITRTLRPWRSVVPIWGKPPVEVPVSVDWQTVCAQRGDAHPEQCPTCGQLLVCTGVIPRGGAPPPILARERAA